MMTARNPWRNNLDTKLTVFMHQSIMSRCSTFDDSMELGDLVAADESMEGSISIGDLMDTSNGSSPGLMTRETIPRSVPTGVVGGIFQIVKNLIQRQDETISFDVADQQTVTGIWEESWQSSSMQLSAAHQSSSTHVAGGFFMPDASIQK